MRTAHATAYTRLRDLPLPSRPKTAAQILEESAQRAEAAGDMVMAHHLRRQAKEAAIAAIRQ